MANRKQNKPIIELDKPSGKVIKYWNSAKAAAEFYKMTVVSISYNVNGINRQAKGHYFRFATAKEIEAYANALVRIDNAINVEPTPKEVELDLPTLPVEIIPEHIQPTEDQQNTLSPFYRLLEAGKKKLNENSK